MFAWLPLIGPIIQGITSIFTKLQDTKIADRQAEVAEAQVSAQIIATTEDDILLKILRDAAILPVVIWSFLIGYDTIIANRWPEWMFHVPDYPASVSYIPYAVLVFLFGNIGLNAWKRK